MTDVLSEVEIIEQLDFEPDVPCEARKSGCENPADWYAVCRWCGFAPAMCDPHVAKCREYGWTVCSKCSSTAPSFDDLVRLVPVKGQK